jgi:hypothetical protein
VTAGLTAAGLQGDQCFELRHGRVEGEPTEAVPAILPVRLVDLEAASPRPSPPIEIVLPTGPTVRVLSGFDPRTLGQVLAVLEGRSC